MAEARQRLRAVHHHRPPDPHRVLGHGLGALVLIALALIYLFFTRGHALDPGSGWQTRAASTAARLHRQRRKRERRVELAAAEAAEDDPDVRAGQRAGAPPSDAVHGRSRRPGTTTTGSPSAAWWHRTCSRSGSGGWTTSSAAAGATTCSRSASRRSSTSASTTTATRDTDRVVVRIDARLKDYVVDRYGRHLKRTGRLGETTRIREFWTLQRRDGHWFLASIEQGAEGQHALDDQIVATPWADERGCATQALVEGAVADAVPEGTKIAEVADLQYEGDAHAAANGPEPCRWPLRPRRAGDRRPPRDRRAGRRPSTATTRALQQIATPQAAARAALRRRLDTPDARRRPRPVGQPDPDRRPGRRRRAADDDDRGRPDRPALLENRDTTAVVCGQPLAATSFTERWTLSLDATTKQPWRITAVGAPVGLA